MKSLPLALAIAFGISACAPVYNCQVEFGQTPPLTKPDGTKYWPAKCVPESVYK